MTTVADLLDFEREHPRAGDRKNEAIRAVLGMTPAAYYRDVFAAAQSLEGWAHDTFTADRVITRVMAAREKRAAWMTRT